MSLTDKITKCLSDAVKNREAAGISVLIRRHNDDLCFASAGVSDIKGKRPVERDSIFRLYSQSKPITAAAAMILVDRALLTRTEALSRPCGLRGYLNFLE